MNISDFLKVEWLPTLGCTEPASIAFAASSARELLGSAPDSIVLTVDTKTYKNCFSVGIPRTKGKTGILWALALGSVLPAGSVSDKLECFKNVNDRAMRDAETLIKGNHIKIELNPSNELLIDCTLLSQNHRARSVIKENHSNLVKYELDGRPCKMPGSEEMSPSQPLPYDLLSQKLGIKDSSLLKSPTDIRRELSKLSISDMIAMSKNLNREDRKILLDGMEANFEISEYGTEILPKDFIQKNSCNIEGKLATLVSGGVYARMWGAEKKVFAASGSGNKGIVCAVPIYGLYKEKKYSLDKVQEALAFAILLTSLTTHHLGSLSSACGCSNAAGIGLCASLVMLSGGNEEQISGAISNMVGNVTGMICDGAKIGCALKTMTSVDAAFRSASLAMSDVFIPFTDGIIGKNGLASLENVGRIANKGMNFVDQEILKIMNEKLKSGLL